MTPQHYARVKEIFQSIDNLPHDEQLAALRKRCDGDDDLLRDVLKLLDYHDPEAAIREGQTVIQAQNQQTILSDAKVQARFRPMKALGGVEWELSSRDLRIGIIGSILALLSLVISASLSMENVESSLSSSRPQSPPRF